MPCYAAHIIEAKKRSDNIGNIIISESIYLIDSEDSKNALVSAESIRDDMTYQDDTETIDGVKSIKIGVYVRKLIDVTQPFNSQISLAISISGSEITYHEYEVESEKDLEKLISGEPVDVKFFD